MKPKHMTRITEFSKAWETILKEPAPDESQWNIWYAMHAEDIIKEGLLQLFIKFRKLGGKMSYEHKIRFLSAVLNRLTKERNDAVNALRALPVHSETIGMSMDDIDDDSRGNKL